jgi:hypothetical protein
MKQSFLNKIVLCEKCHQAFIINVEGDDNICDNCIAEQEITHELIDSGILNGVLNVSH